VKVSQPVKERALQIAGTMASGLQVNGTLAAEKQMLQCCYTALRLVMAMDIVVDAVENEESLAESSLLTGEAYESLRSVVAKRGEDRKAAANVAEESVVTGKPAAKGKVAKETAPPIVDGTQTPEV
jgi:hypothetical protein